MKEKLQYILSLMARGEHVQAGSEVERLIRDENALVLLSSPEGSTRRCAELALAIDNFLATEGKIYSLEELNKMFELIDYS